MSALRTLPASDTPRVVFLGHQQELLDLVKHVYEAHEIEVLNITYAEFLQLDTISLDSNSVYKLIWWVDLKEQNLEQVSDKIKASPLASVVVTGIIPEYFIPEHLKLEKKQRQTQIVWQKINQKLTKAQFFWVRDLLTKSPPPSLEMVFAATDKSVLLDPQSDLFLTDISEYFKSFSKSLVSPHKAKKTVIQGKKRLSGSFIEKNAELFSKYFQRDLEISAVIGRRDSPDLSKFLLATVDSASSLTIDEFVRNYPSWKINIPKLPDKIINAWREPMGLTEGNKLKSPKEELKKTAKSTEILGAKKAKKPTLKPKKTKVEPEAEVENGLSNIFKQRREVDKNQRLNKKSKIVAKIADKSRKNKVLFAGGTVIMGVGGIVLSLFVILSTSTFFARKETVKSFETSSQLFRDGFKTKYWSGFLEKQVGLYDLVLGEELLGNSQDLVSFYDQSRALSSSRKKLDKALSNYVLGVIGRGDSSVVALETLQTSIKDTLAQNQVLEESLVGINPEWFGESQTNLDEYQALINTEKKRLVALQQASGLFKQIFGGEGKRSYALLLQNNLELRPTGGFIQAVALLTFDDGLLIDAQLKSVYELDDRLPGSIEAPREIQKYLGEQNWYLRDGNWDADFPTTAKRIAWFVNEGLGRPVDGVFAMDYLVMQRVLEALGPMELPEYQEIITSKNILERVEFHSDDELVSKKLKNKGYFLSLFSQFLEHVRAVTPENNPAFGLAVFDQLERGNFLLEIFSDEEQALFKKLGWNGEIVNPVCPTKFPGTNCLVDQIYQVEANIGVNRVNDYIDRDVKHEIDLSGDRVKHKRVITMTNRAKTDGWPLGTYRTYLKFVLDKEAKPKSLKINQEKIEGQRVLTYIENDRRMIGVSLEIPKEKTFTIELEYETEKLVETPFSYLLFNQKQPGMEEVPTVISIYHEGYKPSLIAPKAEMFGNTLEFTGSGEEHLFVGVSLE